MKTSLLPKGQKVKDEPPLSSLDVRGVGADRHGTSDGEYQRSLGVSGGRVDYLSQIRRPPPGGSPWYG